ncbi:MAG: hypothetical protein WAK55_33105, partial [Xanthobacteraceae bacterium]
SQGRIPPQGSPFAAFSGTPPAPIAVEGAKAAHIATGSQKTQRPVIALKLVGLLMASARGKLTHPANGVINRAVIYRTIAAT